MFMIGYMFFTEYLEHHGDFTLMKKEFNDKFRIGKKYRNRRNSQRQKRLTHDLIQRWENGVIPYVIAEGSFSG